jgi:hypothetical protein
MKTFLSVLLIAFVTAGFVRAVVGLTDSGPRSPFVQPTLTTDMLGQPRNVTLPDYPVPADPCDTDPYLDGCETAAP